MVSLQDAQTSTRSIEPVSTPRISFSAEFLGEDESFISISPNSSLDNEEIAKAAAEFEFLASKSFANTHTTMLTPDELFHEGKLLPFWQVNQSEKLSKITLKTSDQDKDNDNDDPDQNTDNNNNRLKQIQSTNKDQEPRIWFIDDDPSPRPPKCTVLWKELLRLKKKNASTLSPSSSSSSTSSSSSSLGDHVAEMEEGKEKNMKKTKKGLERTRSGSIRIRPIVNVPICTHAGKTNSLPPLFPLKKGRG